MLAALVAACAKHSAQSSDAAIATADAGMLDDAAACTPPITPDAALASTAPACTANSLPGSCLDVATCYGSRVPTPGLCAGAANIECCTPRYADSIACDPDTMPEPNACLVEAPGDPGCLPGMVLVDTFCVDRFEGSLVEVGSGAWSPYFNQIGRASCRERV